MRFVFRAIGGMFRALFVLIGVLISLVAALGVAISLYPVPTVGFILQASLAVYGYPQASFQIAEVSGTRAVIKDLALGNDAPSVGRIDVAYSVEEVWYGRLRSFRLDGITATVDFAASTNEAAQLSDIRSVLASIFDIGATIEVYDSNALLLNSPVGNVSLNVSSIADFSEVPATIDIQVESTPLDEETLLSEFSLLGTGSIEPAGIDVQGPTKIVFERGEVGGWAIDRLDYDDVAKLRVSDAIAQLTVVAPIHLSLTQINGPEAGSDSAPLSIDLKTGSVDVTADWQNGFSGQAAFNQAEVEVAAWQLRGDRIDIAIPFEQGTLSDRTTVEGLLSDMTPAPRFSRLAFEAAAIRQEDDLQIDASLRPAGHEDDITLSGSYSLASGEGGFDIGPGALQFDPAGLQPADLSPALALFSETSGIVHYNGSIAIELGADIKSRATLRLDSVDTTFIVLSFEDLAGTIDIRDLFQPRTPPSQTLRARQVTAPLPMSEPIFVFQWMGNGPSPKIRIEKAEGGFADGRISVKPTTIDLAATEYDLTLDFDDLSLKTLFEEWADGRVSGAGRMSGSIPVTIGPAGPIITDGELAAQETGFLKVHWGDTRESLENQGNEMALMVQALDNFQFKVLKVSVRRPSEGDLTLQVLLEGANPEVLDGYPFRFNMNLSGDLEPVLQAIAEGQSLTQDLLRARMNNAN